MVQVNQKEIMDVVKKLLDGAQPIKSRKPAKKKGGRVKPTAEETAARIAANDAECIKVFTSAGFKDVQPRKNVLTYNKWMQAGRKVKEGQKSHKVAGFSLFHLDQTQPL